MNKQVLAALLLVATYALLTGASAQIVHKCGNAYSQLPCPDSIHIDPSDQRSETQKKQADLAATRDASTADQLEKMRLAKEKKDLISNTHSNKPSSADLLNFDAASNNHQPQDARNQGAHYFTAQIPGDKKNKKTAQKKAKVKIKTKKDNAR